MQKFLVKIFFLVLLLSAVESWALPPCQGIYNESIWTNCRGTAIYAGGSKYVGEFKGGSRHGYGTYTWSDGSRYEGEHKNGNRHGQGTYTFFDGRVKEGLWEHNKFLSVRKTKYRGSYIVSDTTPGVSSVKDLAGTTAAKREADSERRKREALERRLTVLEAEKQQQQQRIESDTEAPELNIVSAETTGKQGVIQGVATDNTGVAEVTVDGQAVTVDQAGQFKHTTFIPPTGIEVTVQVMDFAGLQSSATVKLERDASSGPAALSFDRLNPLKRKVRNNPNALALIVGIAKYGKTTADAVYADKDAVMFHDYAELKLGVPKGNIMTLINEEAELGEVLIQVKDWLGRRSKPNQSDVYVFFAGHGLASADGEQMYLLPYDGRPRLLDRTAILRDELFADIEAVNPRSVTVFLDTCYSGTTRGVEMLVASRPIGLRVLEQSIPAGFTVFSAAAGDETSKPLTEAEHGLFSYFVMKGMEGEADENSDNRITARELQAYVRQHVVQQSSGTQTPELHGGKERVLVMFQ